MLARIRSGCRIRRVWLPALRICVGIRQPQVHVGSLLTMLVDMFCERKLGISMPSQANSKR